MQTELSLGRQKIFFDRDATQALYSQTIKVPGADSCACIYCKNFATQRHKVFPAEFVHFLRKLGSDPSKEWEAFNYDFDAKNPYKPSLYGGWFVFIGELVNNSETPPPLKGDFAYWCTTSFPAGTLPMGLKLCAVEFLVQIPWVLSEVPKPG